MIISMGGFGIGQILEVLKMKQIFSIHLVSILVSIAVVPMLITGASKAPDFSAPESLSFKRLYHISPLGLIGIFNF